MQLVDRVWWLRFTLSIIAALISTWMGAVGLITSATAIRGLLVAILLYVISYYVVRYVMKINSTQLPKKSDIIVAGLLPYFITWFTFWILFQTLLIWISSAAG